MPRKPDLSRVPTIELIRELERRKAMAGEFESRREALEKKRAGIEAELLALEARASNGFRWRHVNRSAGARARSANHQPLKAVLQRLLKGRTMSVTEAAEAVKKSGYKSNAANFATVVNLTLLKRKDLFTRGAVHGEVIKQDDMTARPPAPCAAWNHAVYFCEWQTILALCSISSLADTLAPSSPCRVWPSYSSPSSSNRA